MIATLEKQLKESQLVSVASYFSKITTEEFKQLDYKVHDEFYQSMASLSRGFNEMQELYNTFERKYDILQDHNTCRREASKASDNGLEFQKNIKDITHDFPLMDKLQTKKTDVTTETWKSICDAVESINKDGQMACK